jgi:hypothetical protein
MSIFGTPINGAIYINAVIAAVARKPATTLR